MSTTTEFEPVIGLEVHTQLATESKIFCTCRARLPEGASVSNLETNANTCPICAGHPGTLPVLNGKVVDYAMRAGLATSCLIHTKNVFARKNYFYPDSPKGYQISQLELPICEHGYLDIETAAGPKRIPIQRIHIEEDAGKSVHHSGYSLVNLNRAGTPLIEIVSGPDLRSSEEAGAYLRSLYSVVTYLGICDGNLQEGNFRCDANVSVRPKGQEKFGTRVEIKNVNSFRFVEKAIDYEIARQIQLIRSGGKVIQETRLYDSDKGVTQSMRSKEEAEDYRYFPDPDLVPIQIDEGWIEDVRMELPELPDQKRARYGRDYGLNPTDAGGLTGSKVLAALFEEVLGILGAQAKELGKPVANLLLNLPLGETGTDLERSKLTPQHLADLVRLVHNKTISSTGAKQVIAAVRETGDAVDVIVERQGLRQVSDTHALGPVIAKVIEGHPAQVAEFLAGKEKLLGFFVGQVMKEMGGKANPALLQDLIKQELMNKR